MTDTDNIVPVRPLDDDAALAWLCAQPEGRTTMTAAALARRWGWPAHRASRRLTSWHKAGLVRRRGRTVTAVQSAVSQRVSEVVADGVAAAVARPASRAVANSAQRIDVAWKNSPSIRLAAQAAAQASQLIDFPPARPVAEPSEQSQPAAARHRPKQEAVDRAPLAVAPPIVPEAPAVTRDVPAPPHRVTRHAANDPAPVPTRSGVVAVSYAAAFALAAVSAGFSITGLTAIFVGAFRPVIAMGVALELGKLSAVAWLGRHGSTVGWPLRAALVALVAALMGLNVIGAYGFLAKAHIGHAIDGDLAIANRAAEVEARLSVQAGVVADLDRRIGQIDKAVETATGKGRTSAAMQLAADQRRPRGELAAERVRQGKTLADLRVEKAGIDGDRRKVEADLGPVRYLATLLGASDQDVLRWFILVVALLLDPAAVLLLLAAASARR